jgi:plastocyanin
MRRLLLISLIFATSAFAKDVYFPIAGSVSKVGSFRTDVRIFNPSPTKDITIQAFVLPDGNANNTGATAHPIVVPKRSMMLLNDVVTQLGGTSSGLAAIHLSSTDDYIATERVYVTDNASCLSGTLGQDIPALDPTISGQKAGLLVALKAGTNFRTNIGVVNPNATTANVTFKLYDKNNALVSTGSPIAVAPMGVIAPTSIVQGFFFQPGSDASVLSDAWVSFSSDQPILTFASVVDNGTNDPTTVPMYADTGASTTPTGTSTKNFAVTTRSWAIDISPTPSGTNAITPGDTVVMTITGKDTIHGLEVDDPNGNQIFAILSIAPGQTITKQFTATTQGTYNYYCVVPSCGTGANQHSAMFGQFTVGQASNPTGGPGY